MDTAARLLRLLVMFSSRPAWTSAELVERLGVDGRTIRRDVARLRDLGYPIAGSAGPHGGYRMGRSGRLPPVQLDDDEAVAIAVALRQASAAGDPRLADACLAAFAKLSQVLPSALRDRVAAIDDVVVHLAIGPTPRGHPETAALMTLAGACRSAERVRFDYQRQDGSCTRRHVEPHRIVTLGNRWYLVAYDLGRDDWRTFRIDRASGVYGTGQRCVPRPAPDVAGMVHYGLAVAGWDAVATVRLHLPIAEARRRVAPTTGIVEADPTDPAWSILRIGADHIDWIARYLPSVAEEFTVIDPPELVDSLRTVARQLAALADRFVPTPRITGA